MQRPGSGPRLTTYPAIWHARAVKSSIPIRSIATSLLVAACQGDVTANGTSESSGTGDPPAGTGTSADEPPTGTTDPVTTVTSSSGEPDPTTVDPDLTTGEPDPTTGAPDECPGQPQGTYNDCINGEACDGANATCLSDNPDDPNFGLCSRECEDDCDCFPDPTKGSADSTCAPILEGGGKACVLDCSGGKSCPSGMACNPDFDICVFELDVPAALPDLYLGYFTIDHTDVTPGMPTTIHFEVGNQGDVDTEYQFLIRVAFSKAKEIGDPDNVLVYEYMYPYIVEANTSPVWFADIEIPEDVVDGKYWIGMSVDHTDVIVESDETNNTLFYVDMVTVTGNPAPVDIDLSPTDPLAAEHQVLQGAQESFGFTVENLGPDDVPAYNVGLYYSIDPQITAADTLICTHADADGLAGMGQEAKQVACAVPKLVGDYYFGVIVDPADALVELEEGNNVAHDPATVSITAPDIDLKALSVTSNDFTVDTGQQVTLTSAVGNEGSDASPIFGVSFYLSSDANITAADKLICSKDSADTLAPAAQTSVASACTIPGVAGGTYWLGAIVDPAGTLEETDETNNAVASVAQMQVKVPDVDLQYELVWDNKGIPPSPGDTVTYKLQVRNNGTAASPPKFGATLRFSLDMTITLADPEICTVSIGPVPAKTITEFTFDCKIPNVPPAWYYLGAIIDPDNQVPETNETNNWGAGEYEPID